MLSGFSAWSDEVDEPPGAVTRVGDCISGGREFIKPSYWALSRLRYFFSTMLCESRPFRSLGVSVDHCGVKFLDELEALRSLGLMAWLLPAKLVGREMAGCNGRLTPTRRYSAPRSGLTPSSSSANFARLFGEGPVAIVIEASPIGSCCFG